ncbi:MAG: hypothetical protein ACJAY8_000483 [Sphingobacteriales bacterium]|jgi:hypothetical protein
MYLSYVVALGLRLCAEPLFLVNPTFTALFYGDTGCSLIPNWDIGNSSVILKQQLEIGVSLIYDLVEDLLKNGVMKMVR